MKQGEPAMVETPDAFIVAVPAEIVEADPKTDPAGYDQIRAVVLPIESPLTSAPSSPMHCAPGLNRASISRSSTASLVNHNERHRPAWLCQLPVSV